MDTCNILLIEDNESDSVFSMAYLRALPKESTFFLCNSLQCAQSKLQDSRYDIVITDLGLPDSHGLGTVKRLMPLLHGTPLIVLTGDTNRTLGLDAIKMGAQDYLEKGRYDMELFHKTILFSLERERLSSK
jgi:DNA-binding response OmpR family regulator